MASISEKYGREFRAVDERIAGYLGRFLRRAKHGPEQERQLLQVLQVEIRDLLRRTLDSEAEVIHLTELLKESHARMQDVTTNSDGHLERILAQHEDRLREQKQKVESEAAEKVLSMETRFKREVREGPKSPNQHNDIVSVQRKNSNLKIRGFARCRDLNSRKNLLSPRVK